MTASYFNKRKVFRPSGTLTKYEIPFFEFPLNIDIIIFFTTIFYLIVNMGDFNQVPTILGI